MFYIVFSDYSTNKCTGIKPPPVCRYIGNSKTDAISAFKDQIDIVFSTGSLYAGYLHLAGFDESLTFVQTFLNKNITDIANVLPVDIYIFKNNLSSAVFDHVLAHSLYKTVNTTTECQCCEKSGVPLYKTVYNTYFCGECWNNNYMCSPQSQLEYYIGLSTGEYSIDSFSAEDCLNMKNAWESYKKLLHKTSAELTAIETIVNPMINSVLGTNTNNGGTADSDELASEGEASGNTGSEDGTT